MDKTLDRLSMKMQNMGSELKEAGGSYLNSDLLDLIEEDELEGGITEGLDVTFE